MILSRRLALGVMLTVGAFAVSVGAVVLHLETRQLAADADDELAVLSAALRVAAENALRDGQIIDIDESLAALDLATTQVEASVYAYPSGTVISASRGAAPDPDLERMLLVGATKEAETRLVRSAGSLGDPRYGAVALRAQDGGVVAVLVTRMAPDMLVEDVTATAARIAISSGMFTLLTTVALLVVLDRVLTAPLARLRQTAERLARNLEDEPAVAEAAADDVAAVTRSLHALWSAVRKSREAELVQLEARLSLVERLGEAERWAAIGQLAAGLAHDVGAPLQVISGRARLLAERDDVPAAAGLGELIAEQAERIVRVVERLRTLAVRPAHTVGPTSLSQPIRRVAELLRWEAERRGVQYTFDIANDLPLVVADGDEVQQVALNLGINALQACPRAARVHLALLLVADGIRLEIVDTGIGMDSETQRQMFDPLYTTRRAEGGTGLGLSVVRTILRRHGASIEVRSALGQGTEVVVTWRFA